MDYLDVEAANKTISKNKVPTIENQSDVMSDCIKKRKLTAIFLLVIT